MKNENNKEQETPRKQITPPYLSVAKLEELIDLISNRNYATFSAEIFRKQGFNGTDATWSVSALKFLGVLNDNGTPTPLMAKFRLLGDARKIEIEKIVKDAYRLLFQAITEPQNLPSDKLVNEFVVQYDMSRSLAESAARIFIKLSELAGLKVSGTTIAKTKKPKVVKKLLKDSKPIKQSISSETVNLEEHTHPIVKGKMSITIPEELYLRSATDDDLNNAWRAILKTAHKFAETYLKEAHDTQADKDS